MRKNLVRAQGLYIAAFSLVTAVAQAAPFRRFDPETPRHLWRAVSANLQSIVTILDALKPPLG